MSIYTIVIQFIVLSFSTGGQLDKSEKLSVKPELSDSIAFQNNNKIGHKKAAEIAATTKPSSMIFSVVQNPAAFAPKSTVKNAASASDVVDNVQKFYKKTKFLEAKFRQVITNKTFGRETISDGKVYLAKPGKMRWDYYKVKKKKKKPVYTKSFISDGKTLWAVLVEDKQFYKKDLSKDMLPVAVSFLTGQGDLNRDFTASLDTESKHGSKNDLVLKLIPKKPSASYKTLWLLVDKEDYRVKSSIVLNAKGDTNKISFFSPVTSKEIASSIFSFNEKANKSFKQMKAPE